MDIAEILPSNPAELHILEERYLGKFSTNIGKVLHITQYTLPDLMNDVNCLSINLSDPSEPPFKGINNLISYLSVCPHRPIMYPSGLYGTTTHDLHQEVSPGDFHSQNISNGLVDFANGGEFRTPNYKQSISCIILYLLVFLLTGQPKTNEPLHPIPQTQKFSTFN